MHQNIDLMNFKSCNVSDFIFNNSFRDSVNFKSGVLLQFKCNANFSHLHSTVRARVRVSHLLVSLVLSAFF